MDQPVRGRVRGCLGNQEKEPLRNPGLDIMPDERGLSGSSFSCEKQMASGLEVVQCPLETGRDDQSMLGTFSVNCGASSLGILFVRPMNRSRGSASIWLPCGSR